MLALLALSCAAVPAAAQSCSASASGIDFGTIDVLPGTLAQTAGTLDVSCSGTPNDTVRVCVNMGGRRSGAALHDQRRELIGPVLRSVPGCWPLCPVGQLRERGHGRPDGPDSERVRSGQRQPAGLRRLYPGQQTASVGNYTAAFQGTTANITYAEGSTLSCNAIGTNETPVNFTVQATVTANCNVSASALDFGSLSTLNQGKDRDGHRFGAMQRQCALYGGSRRWPLSAADPTHGS